MHDCLRCAPTRGIRRVAIHPVLGDVDIKAAQIDSAKLIKYVINLVELERLISQSTIASHLVEPLQNPAIDERCTRHRGCRPAGVSAPGYRKIVKISQQDAQGVAHPAIGVAQTREHLFRERNVGGVIDAARPKSEQIGAVPADEVISGRWLRVRA